MFVVIISILSTYFHSRLQMLSDFLLQTLHRELLEDTIRSVPPASNKDEIIKKIKQLATRTVSRASSKAWKKSVWSLLH